jgi:hypothetical protein
LQLNRGGHQSRFDYCLIEVVTKGGLKLVKPALVTTSINLVKTALVITSIKLVKPAYNRFDCNLIEVVTTACLTVT